MATTLNEAEIEEQRAKALTELRQQRAAKLAEAAALEDSIAKLEAEDLKKKSGSLKVKHMTKGEMPGFVDRRGLEAFIGLLGR